MLLNCCLVNEPMVVRDVGRLRLPQIGRVAPYNGDVPFLVLDAQDQPVVSVLDYLRTCQACGFEPLSIEAYSRALLRWFRFLWAVEVPWNRATSVEARDFTLWLQQNKFHRRRPRPGRAGTVNAQTGKRRPGAGTAPATINQTLSVVSEFYRHHMSVGAGPLLNPIPARRPGPGGERYAAHHNPLQAFPSSRKSPLRQKVPKRAPRSLPDAAFDELFAAMKYDRDRALLAFYVSSGARPSELLGLSNRLVDPGNQTIGVVRKGTKALQHVPASPDAFVWLRLYQRDLPASCLRRSAPVFWTLRRPLRPLEYDAARAVLLRAQETLGTDWSLHDLRHTALMRMSQDLNLVEVRDIAGHGSLRSTEPYLQPRQEEVLAHAREHFERLRDPQRRHDAQPHLPSSVLGYDADDMLELFGGVR
ncbi:tyrosine-type recombinase/integrase [Streptomyces sp. NPDC057430]|uniref:tyrosine-type recombinase/integrase n=1 Tax=Streptomyces sp. NPDC057430 TaxID=3346131 RepID=UPI00368B29AB